VPDVTVTHSRNEGEHLRRTALGDTPGSTAAWQSSIVIPVYNPGGGLSDVVKAVRNSFGADGVPVHVIIVDDGSDEPLAVPDVGDVVILRHDSNRGKGAALRTGMCYALENDTSEIIGFVDGDGDICAEQLVNYGHILLEERAAGFPTVAVIGSKWADGSHAAASRFRAFQSQAFSLLARTLMPVGVRDTQAGIKVFHADWLRHALGATRQNGFLLDVELLAYAAARQQPRTIIEQPVTLTSGTGGSTTSARTAVSMAWGLFIMSATTRRGKRLRTA
jgi:hypothetical protein